MGANLRSDFPSDKNAFENLQHYPGAYDSRYAWYGYDWTHSVTS